VPWRACGRCYAMVISSIIMEFFDRRPGISRDVRSVSLGQAPSPFLSRQRQVGSIAQERDDERRLPAPGLPEFDPNEMGLPDPACLAYRLSQSPYRPLFESVWGEQAFRIQWPPDVEQVCGTPGPAPASDPFPVHLSKVDHGQSNSTYDQFGLSIARYEASPEVSPFSSKFDYALANPDKPVLSRDELASWNLFRGRAMCNTCHLDGTENTTKQRNPTFPSSSTLLFWHLSQHPRI
jgi:hypothetical protein